MFRLLRSCLLLCVFLNAISLTPLWAQQSPPVEFLQMPKLSGTRGGNLILAIDNDPTNFNQIFVTGAANRAVTERISGDLVHINRETLQVEPALATRWEKDPSGRIYTIHLRKGVRFSDGSPFTADDVVFSFQMLTDPKNQCVLSGQITIDGAFPSVNKVDDNTVRLTFPRAVGMELRMLDSVPMLPAKRLAKARSEGQLAKAWGVAVNPADVVGLGPFRLKEYLPGQRVVLERNPHYWKKDRKGQQLPYLDSITYLIIRGGTSEQPRFSNGELDLFCSPSLTPQNWAKLMRAPQNFIFRKLGPGLTTNFLWFNLNSGVNRAGKPYVDPEKKALFEKPEFRRAISYALNRGGMIKSLLYDLGVPQFGPISPGNKVWYNDKISKTDFDLSRARQLLAQIGLKETDKDGILLYGKNKRPLELTLLTSSNSILRENLIQVIQNDLKAIGIRSAVQLLISSEIAARILGSFDYEAVLFGFTVTDVVPDLQTDLWYSSGESHLWNPNQKRPERAWEAEMDELTSTLVKSADAHIRKAAFNRIQEIWAVEMPAIPTVTPIILAAWSKKLGNVRPSILVPHLIWNAEEITKRGN